MSVDTSKECLLGNPKWQCGSLNLLFNMFTSYGAIQMTYVTWEDFLIVGFFLRNQSIWSMLSKLSKLFVFLPYYPFDFCRDCNNISELCPSVYVVCFFFFMSVCLDVCQYYWSFQSTSILLHVFISMDFFLFSISLISDPNFISSSLLWVYFALHFLCSWRRSLHY